MAAWGDGVDGTSSWEGVWISKAVCSAAGLRDAGRTYEHRQSGLSSLPEAKLPLLTCWHVNKYRRSSIGAQNLPFSSGLWWPSVSTSQDPSWQFDCTEAGKDSRGHILEQISYKQS